MARYRREALINICAIGALAVALALSNSGPTMAQTTTGPISVDHPGARFYQYAPAIVVEGGFENLFTCENVVSGVIRDNIVHRRYVPRRYVPGGYVNGIFVAGHFVDGRELHADIALPPSDDPLRFDSVHVCDPEIVAGTFTYRGPSYHYALLYTTNNKPSAVGNQIGIAFANSLDGPWQRAAEPLLAYDFSGAERASWGVGQPAAVNTDRGDGFLLFYTQGGHGRTQTLMSHVRVHSRADLNDPPFIVDAPLPVSESGLQQADGRTPDYLSNAAVAYWPASNAFVIVRPQRPLPASQPNFLETQQEIDTIDSTDLLVGGGTWRRLMVIGRSLTGAARNHNAGIEKDIWGAISAPSTLTTFVTTSEACADPLLCYPQQLWNYRVRRYDIPISSAR
jgi:hypothetical protein